VALISGGAEGLGYGIAERIATEGGSGGFDGHQHALLNSSGESLKAKDLLACYPANVALEKEVIAAIDAVENAFGED